MKNLGVLVTLGIFLIGIIAGGGKLIAQTSNQEKRIEKTEDKLEILKDEVKKTDAKADKIGTKQEATDKQLDKIDNKLDQIVGLLLEKQEKQEQKGGSK